ncbi:NCS2 family permease [Peribacillus alkalitolerans]|uniref:NCS2 family permease n=1 Tax=Peribacillus alkalitolerans TaxID=1550385 RepID=UPI0013D6C212|nr:NCS2 family permease [Peribacillus alkalitolerans]
MLQHWIQQRFSLVENQTTLKKEILAGAVSFFTIVYIIAVNSSILAEAGIPREAGIIATALVSFISCVLVGLWSNTPIILVPGMGLNAMFTYTIVQNMGFSWQQALGVVTVSGILFAIVAFTPLVTLLSDAIPQSLKEAITVGLGLFLTMIGLEKGGLIQTGEHSILMIGQFNNPIVLATILTLIVTVTLFIKNVPGNFLISMLIGTAIAALFGLVTWEGFGTFSEATAGFKDFQDVFFAFSLSNIWSTAFWVASFSFAMVLVFENIGLVHGHTSMINKPEKFVSGYRSTAISSILCGLFGSSPSVATVETASGIAAGGRTGLTAVTTGLLFLVSLFFIPVIKIIPGSAIAPILIIIGALMLQNVKHIDFNDFTEAFPAFLIIVMIPFTYSIADGIAFGFITYPIIKLLLGKRKQVSLPLILIAGLFLLNFILHSFS